MKLLAKHNSHIGAFLIGALLSALFFAGQLQEPAVVLQDSSKQLTGAVFFAYIKQNEPLSLYRPVEEISFETVVAEVSTSSSSTTLAVATSSVQNVVASSSAEVIDDGYDEMVGVSVVSNELEPEEVGLVETAIELEIVQIPEEVIPVEPVVAEADVQEETVGGEESERKLPDGVYVLANGDYVDKNGDKISGDPYLYNYKPPNDEDEFTTPGGVVMDRFGNILFQPETVDESLVLIPATIIDPENPPSTVSPIYIPRYVIGAIERNRIFSCSQIGLYNNERALCELYKERLDDYQWIKVDELEE